MLTSSGAAGAGAPSADGRAQKGPQPRVSAPEKCKSARQAVPHYRARTWSWQALREGELSDRTPKVRGRSCHWARYAASEHQARSRSAKRSYERWLRRVPVGEEELRAWINDDCLEEIVDRETADTWSPTVYNYSGSGAYGLPQALPGHKMASAGSDWLTNPKTQILWMRGYVLSRYGGSCSALAHHNANGWY